MAEVRVEMRFEMRFEMGVLMGVLMRSRVRVELIRRGQKSQPPALLRLPFIPLARPPAYPACLTRASLRNGW